MISDMFQLVGMDVEYFQSVYFWVTTGIAAVLSAFAAATMD